MSYAVIADIHGNLGALDAILDEVSKDESINGVLVLGDIAVGGPDPCEVVERLQGIDNALCLTGNTERWVIGGVTLGLFGEKPEDINVETVLGIARLCGWTEALLMSSGRMEWLKCLPDRFEVILPNGKKVLAVHGSPLSDEKGFTEKLAHSEQEKLLLNCDADVLIAGHTHTEYHNRVGQTEIHVIPSAGIPTGPDKSAPFALLSTAGEDVELKIKRVAYDVSPVIERLKRQNHPRLKRALIDLLGDL